MQRLNGYALGAATLILALGIGYVMQYGLGLPGATTAGADAPLTLTDIEPASSAVVAPTLPTDIVYEVARPDAAVQAVAATPDDAVVGGDSPILPLDLTEVKPACDVTLTASPVAGAMARLTLTAPCHKGDRVTIHHQGLMFTEVMTDAGTLQVTVPAFAEDAAYIASFANGDGATAMTEISSLPFYDRVAVQWRGEAGLQLHAREFEAAYFSDGHIWSAAKGDLAATARGERGFLVRLGREDMPDALVAEIYSFPTGTTKAAGDILLSVEAEVTSRNCGGTVEAQTLQLRDQQSLRVRNLALEMPVCGSVGDFLVLKNLLEDLTIAAR
jgi:hypothetical protein